MELMQAINREAADFLPSKVEFFSGSEIGFVMLTGIVEYPIDTELAGFRDLIFQGNCSIPKEVRTGYAKFYIAKLKSDTVYDVTARVLEAYEDLGIDDCDIDNSDDERLYADVEITFYNSRLIDIGYVIVRERVDNLMWEYI